MDRFPQVGNVIFALAWTFRGDQEFLPRECGLVGGQRRGGFTAWGHRLFLEICQADLPETFSQGRFSSQFLGVEVSADGLTGFYRRTHGLTGTRTVDRDQPTEGTYIR